MGVRENNFEVSLTKEVCFICTKVSDGAIVMNTVLTEQAANDVKKLHGEIIGFGDKPCKQCRNNMEIAFLFISMDEDKTNFEEGYKGIYRTGKIIGVKKESPVVTEFVAEHAPHAVKLGYLFLDDKLIHHLNLIQ